MLKKTAELKLMMWSYRLLCPCPSRQSRASPWPPGRSRWGGWSPCWRIIQETSPFSPWDFIQNIAKDTTDKRLFKSLNCIECFQPINKLQSFGQTSACCSSQPSMVHWLSSPIFPCWSFVCPAIVTSDQISLLLSPDPQTHTFSESLW